MINLGDRVRDKVTGFEGIVVCRSEWLQGCVRLSVQPEKLDKEGKVKESVTFDELQLEMVKQRVHNGRQETGGPRPDPRRQPDPVR